MFASLSRRTVSHSVLKWSQARCLSSAAPNKLSAMDLLKELRSKTGAPIVECKKALAETDHQISAAVDWLRQHGAAKVSSKVAGRETTEGLVAIAVSADHQRAALVQVASETDFASRSTPFVNLVSALAETALEEGEGFCKESDKVKGMLDDAIVAIRENLSVPIVTQLQSSEDGILVGYVHNKGEHSNGTSTAVGMSAALVQVDGNADTETLQAVGKKLAMHVVAARPLYCTPAEVPGEEIAKEKKILTKQMADSGKPDHVLEKIVEGRMRKFYQGICLTEQEHMIEEDNPVIGEYLKQQGIAVKRFELLSIR